MVCCSGPWPVACALDSGQDCLFWAGIPGHGLGFSARRALLMGRFLWPAPACPLFLFGSVLVSVCTTYCVAAFQGLGCHPGQGGVGQVFSSCTALKGLSGGICAAASQPLPEGDPFLPTASRVGWTEDEPGGGGSASQLRLHSLFSSVSACQQNGALRAVPKQGGASAGLQALCCGVRAGVLCGRLGGTGIFLLLSPCLCFCAHDTLRPGWGAQKAFEGAARPWAGPSRAVCALQGPPSSSAWKPCQGLELGPLPAKPLL